MSTVAFLLLWVCYRFDAGARGLSVATLVLAGSSMGGGEDRLYLEVRKAARKKSCWMKAISDVSLQQGLDNGTMPERPSRRRGD